MRASEQTPTCKVEGKEGTCKVEGKDGDKSAEIVEEEDKPDNCTAASCCAVLNFHPDDSCGENNSREEGGGVGDDISTNVEDVVDEGTDGRRGAKTPTLTCSTTQKARDGCTTSVREFTVHKCVTVLCTVLCE